MTLDMLLNFSVAQFHYLYSGHNDIFFMVLLSLVNIHKTEHMLFVYLELLTHFIG